jgi:hypothetical protein
MMKASCLLRMAPKVLDISANRINVIKTADMPKAAPETRVE